PSGRRRRRRSWAGRWPSSERVDPQAHVALRADAPPTVVALAVGLVVVAVPLQAQRPAVAIDVDVVEHGPGALGLPGPQQRDLGHVPMVDRGAVAEGLLQAAQVLLVGPVHLHHGILALDCHLDRLPEGVGAMTMTSADVYFDMYDRELYASPY